MVLSPEIRFVRYAGLRPETQEKDREKEFSPKNMFTSINPKRIHTIKELPDCVGPVVYWMDRDQRVNDNWSLLFAQSLATKHKMPLAVVYCLVPGLADATQRKYGFMVKGLAEIELTLKTKSIPFFLLTGAPEKVIPEFVRNHSVAKLVTDFNPLRTVRKCKESVARTMKASFYEVDAHNIIPARIISNKQEFGAYTIRPKVHRLLPEYLDEFPPLHTHPFEWNGTVPAIEWRKLEKKSPIDRGVTEVNWIVPGERAALASLKHFLRSGLSSYGKNRNDPTLDGQSNLSPYFHFGHLSPQRAALEVVRHHGSSAQEIVQRRKNGASDLSGNEEAFLEELIVRRELSDNYVFNNLSYDSFEGFPLWAQRTLNDHRGDTRKFTYSLHQWENASTHDPLWNAAQMQIAITGKMHGYMRMYWGKKILEWTPSPDEAMVIANYLNNKYAMDGCDPNGYTGVAWCIGGVHDRAWFERPVFGKIRYMNESGCARKFIVNEYIKKFR